MKKSLKNFLQIPGMFQEILYYINSLKEESKIVTNVIQGNLWIKKYADKTLNEIVIPLLPYRGSYVTVKKFQKKKCSKRCCMAIYVYIT